MPILVTKPKVKPKPNQGTFKCKTKRPIFADAVHSFSLLLFLPFYYTKKEIVNTSGAEWVR